MSKFDCMLFYEENDMIAVSKEKHTLEEAICIAKIELGCDRNTKSIDCSHGYVRHYAGRTVDGEKKVGWWLEQTEKSNRSVPCWIFQLNQSPKEAFNGHRLIIIN